MAKCKVCGKQIPRGSIMCNDCTEALRMQMPPAEDEVTKRLKSIMSQPYVKEATYDRCTNIYTVKLADDSVFKSSDTEAWYGPGSMSRVKNPWLRLQQSKTVTANNTVPPNGCTSVKPAPVTEVEIAMDEVQGDVLAHMMCDKDSYGEVPTQRKIREITDAMKDLLLYKNQKYGDSAINPIEIFTKHLKTVDTKTAAILVRLDDKLSRVKNADTLRTNDICDLIGYLTLLNVALGTTAEDIAKFKD